MQQHKIILRQLGLQPYAPVSQAMHNFTEFRTDTTPDEIWLVEHQHVFTQGQAGKAEHVLMPGDIPVIQSDRGGQVTYHGPGQQVMYVMVDLKRAKIGVRQLVTAIENTVIETLAHFNIDSHARPDAPGVYVEQQKICSLGLRIRRGCSFHGLALNIAMDLEPFQRINPCGYAGMQMTQVSALQPGVTVADVQPVLVREFTRQLGYPTAKLQPWSLSDYLLSSHSSSSVL
ncbi:octanoyltransferase [Yersinia pestis subsp. microtus bv. Altaica]|uniref:Octanoyltransferase n=1 Tax=Yersinia pestis PY-08 TaxID=992134 RepID=A0AB72ZI57_YERPE|nr:lipoyl-protein ligase [Yersinia pestis biovar Medievalis str. Harbin 35]AJI90328.1 lipoyl(octanoyl) transferase [Yersinia pestis]AJI98480.1 lipoyl(octanoyl) transferase [Yersinia pestis Pestoides F]AJJ03366.1 lipoyl(octanoyl) transferase [Yersinia pseudotuberculosis]AJJ55255.1 lipoyl(octanoyl) transferase [Yersinia pseudotuberculosis IP 32953]AJJ67824.1 lipoyl(octanoyl) transferase [Yersinia pseudotuberculosis PB1/+]AJJ74665.1 lipoyl(octanoyl) transferase [Yersinia pestis A1122]AJJ80310.1